MINQFLKILKAEIEFIRIKQVWSSCHHGRECHTSINQSIKQKAPSHSITQSINQSIRNFLLIFIDSTNQAIKQSTYQSRDISSIPNQSIN